jgi:nucleotide-binding universal stress UspA family protein
MLAIQTILHPTDFSERSKSAYEFACSLARDYGAKLVVLYVVEPPVPIYGDGVAFAPPEPAIEPLRAELDRFIARNANLHVEGQLAEGDAGVEIVRVTEELKADLIVMGTHGRTGLSRLLMGSVAEYVLRKARCPVLTVKNPVPKAQTCEKPSLETAGCTAN